MLSFKGRDFFKNIQPVFQEKPEPGSEGRGQPVYWCVGKERKDKEQKDQRQVVQWEYSQDPFCIKEQDGARGIQVLQKGGGDQESGKDEEYVDPYPAKGE